MTSPHYGTVTNLIDLARLGDAVARERLYELLEVELSRRAKQLLNRDQLRKDFTAGDLVQETVQRILQDEKDVVSEGKNRAFLFCCGSRRMRQILADYAKRRDAKKHGGQEKIIQSSELIERVEKEWNCNMLYLYDALEHLGHSSPEERDVIDLRYFARMTIDETAESLGISTSTVERVSARALAKLRHLLSDHDTIQRDAEIGHE